MVLPTMLYVNLAAMPGEFVPVLLLLVLIVCAAVWFKRFLKKIEIAAQVRGFQQNENVDQNIDTLIKNKNFANQAASAVRKNRESLSTRDSVRAALREVGISK